MLDQRMETRTPGIRLSCSSPPKPRNVDDEYSPGNADALLLGLKVLLSSQSRVAVATTFQPASMVSECPRSSNSLYSVTDGLSAYSLKTCLVTLDGTVVVVAAHQQERPPDGVVGVDGGRRVLREGGGGVLEERTAGTGDGPRLEQGVGLLLGQGVAEAVVELLGRQRHRALLVGRVAQHRESRAELGERQRRDALDGRRVDGDRGDREVLGDQLLGDEPSEECPTTMGLSAMVPITDA